MFTGGHIPLCQINQTYVLVNVVNWCRDGVCGVLSLCRRRIIRRD